MNTQQLDLPTSSTYYRDSFKYGVGREQDVKEKLRGIGYTVTDSTRRENVQKDIDFWVSSPNQPRVSVSAKSPRTKGDCVCLEYYGVRRNDAVRERSWFLDSQADVLLVSYPDGSVYYFWFDALRHYMTTHPELEFKGLAERTRTLMVNSDSRHVDFLNKWVSRDDLITHEVGYRLC